MDQRIGSSSTDFQRRLEPLLRPSTAYAFAIVRNREDAEDALQDAAIKAYLGRESYNHSRAFKGWWFAILRNCCLDLLRRRRTRPSTVPMDCVECPGGQLADPGGNEELRLAMDKLAPAHREILELRYFAECSYRDIAAALAIPEGTVMSRLYAARQALAAIYRKERHEAD